MRRLIIGILSLAVCWGMPTRPAAAQPISFEVVAAFAPNGRAPYTSPSWSQYVPNAIGALELGVPEVGDRLTDPAAYEAVVESITPLEMFYTDFKSWRGLADPNPAFTQLGSPFLAETGNRVHFGVHITSDGTADFSLMDLSWALDSNDGTNWFDQSGDFSQALYSPTRVGINYGADNAKGGGDDLIYDGGELGSLSVHELMYVGVGEGFAALTGDGVNNQDSIADNVRDLLESAGDTVFDLAGVYTLVNPLGGAPLVASDSIEIRIPAGMGGDFNFDKDITSDDADLLTAIIAGGGYDILFDMNLDDDLNFDDLEILVHDVRGTYFGDANFDGLFNSTDLINILAAGKYETGQAAVWSTGDFNADGLFGTGDLILALADGGYENGALPPAAVAVPEPAAATLALLGLALLTLRRWS
jgi:hypothetical protein